MSPGSTGLAAAALAMTLVASSSGCGPQTADYSTVWTTPAPGAASPGPESVSAEPTPIAEYLAGIGVSGEQVPISELTDITVTLPRPAGWSTLDGGELTPGTEAIAKGDGYPRAIVVVLRLTGNFDVPAALRHANDSALLTKDFKKLNFSDADFNGFPSAMIEGSYELNGVRMQSYNRVVIPVTPAPEFDRYLVQFTVTTRADEAAEEAPDVLEIIKGFSVAVA